MASSEPLDVIYARTMRDHPYGYALYHPTTDTEMFPGAIGYFNSRGRWCHLANLRDEKSLGTLSLSPLRDELDDSKPEAIVDWEPKYSLNVTSRVIGAKGGVEEGLTAGFVQAGAQIGYKSSEGRGAVLVTTPPIEHKSFSSDSPIKAWYKANAVALLKSKWGADIKEYGLFVITQTYSTPKCSLTSWTNPDHEVVVKVDAGAAGFANAGAEYSYSVASSAGGWNHYTTTPPTQLVVFAGGLMFRTKKLLNKYITTTKDLTTRTSTRTPVLDIEEVEDFEVQDPSGETLEGSVERYGKPVDAIHDMNQDLGDWED